MINTHELESSEEEEENEEDAIAVRTIQVIEKLYDTFLEGVGKRRLDPM